MTEEYDVVVAGAGHNSLVAAEYLAKAGLSCLILEEARPVIEGNTMTNSAMVLLKDIGRDLSEVIGK